MKGTGWIRKKIYELRIGYLLYLLSSNSLSSSVQVEWKTILLLLFFFKKIMNITLFLFVYARKKCVYNYKLTLSRQINVNTSGLLPE